VFGDKKIADAAAQTRAWEEHKAREKLAREVEHPLGYQGVLSDIPLGLPALTRSAKLGRRASRAGFDWPDAEGPRAKVDEELRELDLELGAGGDKARLEHEVGDTLFAIVNLCRHLDIDPESALRAANSRFQRRFEFVEQALEEQGQQAGSATLEQMDRLWDLAKQKGL
jgi:MazG family protein